MLHLGTEQRVLTDASVERFVSEPQSVKDRHMRTYQTIERSTRK